MNCCVDTNVCEPDMRISMFNCDVSQTLSAINSAADSIKIISTEKKRKKNNVTDATLTLNPDYQ
jgi:hypothetical protein